MEKLVKLPPIKPQANINDLFRDKLKKKLTIAIEQTSTPDVNKPGVDAELLIK